MQPCRFWHHLIGQHARQAGMTATVASTLPRSGLRRRCMVGAGLAPALGWHGVRLWALPAALGPDQPTMKETEICSHFH